MSRADFERWMVEDYKCVVGSSDPYPAGIERDMWKCWQAASRDRYHEVCTAREAIHLARIAELEAALNKIIQNKACIGEFDSVYTIAREALK